MDRDSAFGKWHPLPAVQGVLRDFAFNDTESFPAFLQQQLMKNLTEIYNGQACTSGMVTAVSTCIL